MSLARYFPFLRWARPTPRAMFADARAGFSVGLVLVPQAVAYATLGGMPPETGLYAAMIPSIIGVLWGSSSLLAAGPVALTGLLTFGSYRPAGPDACGDSTGSGRHHANPGQPAFCVAYCD